MERESAILPASSRAVLTAKAGGNSRPGPCGRPNSPINAVVTSPALINALAETAKNHSAVRRWPSA